MKGRLLRISLGAVAFTLPLNEEDNDVPRLPFEKPLGVAISIYVRRLLSLVIVAVILCLVFAPALWFPEPEQQEKLTGWMRIVTLVFVLIGFLMQLTFTWVLYLQRWRRLSGTMTSWFSYSIRKSGCCRETSRK